MDNEKNAEKFHFFGVIKTAFAYGFYGFVLIAALYAISMVFWNNPALYDLYDIYFAQTFVLIMFCSYLAGFFGQIAVYRKYGRQFKGNLAGTETEKIRYYGALSGFFTGGLIILLPVLVIIMTSFKSPGHMLHTIWIVLSSYTPFVAAGIISGFIGAYIAGTLLKRGYLKRDDAESDIREKTIGYGLLALLLLFVPLFFSLAAAHLIEPEVIVSGHYDDNTAYFVKTDSSGNIQWESSPLHTAASLAYYAVLMKNESYALFGYEPSARGNICTVTYMDKNGIIFDTIPFLRSNAPPAHVIEIPGRGFLLSDELNDIVSLDYNGTVTGHYTLPEEYQRTAGSPEMVYSGGDSVFLRWGRYCCIMNLDGNFSDVRSYGEYGTSGRPYRMDVKGISELSGGGYLICVNDDDSRELKVLNLDQNLNLVSERIIGSTHGSCISVFERNESYVIITDDVLRFEDRPYDYKQYFRIYDANEQYYDIMPGSDYLHTEVFDETGFGYSMFTVSDTFLSDEKEVFMKRYGYDGECQSSVSILKGRFLSIKIMQTPDGGYLISYVAGEA